MSSLEWTLKLKSSVELRTFKLTNEVDVLEEKLAGATIALYKENSIVIQMQSDGSGDFTIDVPGNGEFTLMVSYPGCNAKKFAISTVGVPEAMVNDNFKPSFGIEGVIMAKPFPNINYTILEQPLARIVYNSKGKKFDDDKVYTNQMLQELSKIRDSESKLIENFTSINSSGDVALNKGDCLLAKSNYEKAMTIIPGERYPIGQLSKVENCLKDKAATDKKVAEEVNAKSNEAKLAAEKLAAEKLLKENAAKEKALQKLETDKIAKEKALIDKAVTAKPVTEKEVTEQPVKEKVVDKPKEQTNTITPVNNDSKSESEIISTGDAKHSIPQTLGSATKYKENIKRGDELFKMKRYAEAKPVYEEALKFKENDPYATGRLAEIEKLKK